MLFKDSEETDIVCRESLPNRTRDRLRVYFRGLGRVEKVDEGILQRVREAAVRGKGGLIVGLTDNQTARQLNRMFAQALITLGMPPYVSLNVYDFVSIQFGEHPEFMSYRHLKMDTVLVWGGFQDGINVNLENRAIEFLTRRDASGGTTILLLKRNQYSDLEEFALKHTKSTIDISTLADHSDQYAL